MDICGRGMREESLQTSAWEATCGLARAAKGLFTWENTHWLEFHTDMTSWFHAALHLYVCMFFPHPMTNMTMPFWNDENYACTSCSSPPADRLHTRKMWLFVFTWYCCKILYQSEILVLLQQPQLTPGWLVPAWHFAQTGWYRVNKYRATRENRS